MRRLLSISPVAGAAIAWAVLFPTDDASLMAVSKHEPRLAAHFRLVAENWSIGRQLLHKEKPMRSPPMRDPGATRLGAGLRAQSPGVRAPSEFPLLLKPSVGHVFFKEFGVKMLHVHSVDELEAWMVRLRSYAGTMMLSEFIPGDDTCGANYNSFYVDGVPVQEFTAAKLRLKPRSIGFPTAVVSRHIPEIIERGRAMIKAIGYRGFSCMEFRRDSRDGRYKLMEINARHNYSGMLALACGLNFPYLSYLQASGRSITRLPAVPVQERYWVDEERDIGGLAAAACKGCRAILSYSRPVCLQGYLCGTYARRSTTCLAAGSCKRGQQAQDRTWCGPVRLCPASLFGE